MNPGKHIVLEGLDASGKKTQSHLLIERLNDYLRTSGQKAHLMSFPDYSSPYGRLIAEYLAGGAPIADPMYASTLYAADRHAKVGEITQILNSGDWLVCDRYVSSNSAHQVARMQPELREVFSRHIEHMEYEILGIPRPTLTILLDVEVDLSLQKAGERRLAEGGGVDIHEQDGAHIQAAWEQYHQLAAHQGWPIIPCAENGKLHGKQEIADQVWQVVNPLLADNTAT